MKIVAHIAYFWHETNTSIRSKYIVSVINNYLNTWENITQFDIFIHTNSEQARIIESEFSVGTHMKLYFVVHDLSNENPRNLTWKHRTLMETQKDDYDVFVYLEDDTGIPSKAFNYWLHYKDIFKDLDIDIGFARVETIDNIDFCCHDILTPCEGRIDVLDRNFTWNHAMFAAFWICDKEELEIFMKSVYWKQHGYFPAGPTQPPSQFIQESAGIGFKMRDTSFYRGSFYPLDDNNTHISDMCLVYHLANNYITQPRCAQGKFNYKRMTENIGNILNTQIILNK